MKKKTWGILCLFLLVCFGFGACQSQKASQSEEEKKEEAEKYIENSDIKHTIGIAVFDSEDPELRMFINYYRNYIKEGFPVEFIYSEKISSSEDEIAFIRQMKEEGAEGIISFYGLGLSDIVDACEEMEMYYVLGSTSISDSAFDEVKDNPWFLGTIGPASDEETKAGYDMAEQLSGDGAKSYLILSGGAAQSLDNYMHFSRVQGMLNALADSLGLNYGEEVSDLAAVEELCDVDTGRDDIKITICPGYLSEAETVDHIEQTLENGGYEVVMSAVGINSISDLLEEARDRSETGMTLGVVDSFTEENRLLVENVDAKGNPLLSYVKGKYASMVAPAFVAVYNAIEGDVDVVKPDGEAFRLYQQYWSASGKEEYLEYYGYTQGIFANAYSNTDLMSVIKEYDDTANFQRFQELTQACDIDSVKERLQSQ